MFRGGRTARNTRVSCQSRQGPYLQNFGRDLILASLRSTTPVIHPESREGLSGADFLSFLPDFWLNRSFYGEGPWMGLLNLRPAAVRAVLLERSSSLLKRRIVD
jgi:hypothetical protein